MSEEYKVYRAKQVYKMLCDVLDGMGWVYEKEEELLLVHFGVTGEDIPMKFVITADAERQMICLTSPLPFKMEADKRVEGAIAVCMASYGMADGSFDYDISDGSISFRMTESFHDCALAEPLFEYLISCACSMVDKYNDKFLSLSKGLVDITAFQKT